jgi:mycofactocin precursor
VRKEERDLQTGTDEQMEPDTKDIIEEIEVEDITVDGICGVY